MVVVVIAIKVILTVVIVTVLEVLFFKLILLYHQAMLKQWQEFQEQARLRDHRTVG